jgi:hypothetical protein
VFDLEEEYEKNPEKFHCDHSRAVDITEIDPSLSFGFLIKSHLELQNLLQSIQSIN